jgi:hypothetical protein
VGLGGSASPIGDISGQVVYAMRITRRMTMREYDQFCRVHLQGKIPDRSSRDFRKKVGDCIYDFSMPGDPSLRPSVHEERNRAVDLGGDNALLSEHFYYFGDHPRPLPSNLRPIVQQRQGHKSRANVPYADVFASWIDSLGLEPSGLHGEPQLKAKLLEDPAFASKCSTRDLAQDEDDEIC